jgi:GTP-binding protein YchF
MEIGLVGLPNAGKSTLFNALTKAGAPAADYPFTTIEPNVGVVTVPDPRLETLVELFKSKKLVPTTIRFVDIAGLIKGASRGEGLGNQFLGHIREVDAIAQVVRCFEAGVVKAAHQIGPRDDIDTIITELALADLTTCEKRQQRLAKLAKSGDKDAKRLFDELDKLMSLLSEGKLAGTFPEIDDFSDLCLLTAKPMIFVANIDEEEFRSGNYRSAEPVIEYTAQHECDALVVSAKIESELGELDNEDAAEFREELGMDESGLDKLIRAAYHTLGLRSFLTAGPDECRAWTIRAGQTAVEAAGTIHTDFARGFIKAEVTPFEQLVADGSFAAAREAGHLRLEGKDYVVQDGDVITFKFNV